MSEWKPSCGECRFVSRVPDPVDHYVVMTCHRLPPQVVMEREKWPSVGPMDWCGEFRKTPEAEAAGAAGMMDILERMGVKFAPPKES